MQRDPEYLLDILESVNGVEFALRQRSRTVGSLVFQEMANVLASGNPEQATAADRMPRELEIYKSGRAIVTHQQVRLLGKVVVHDAGAMHSSQQACGAVEIGFVRRSAEMHRSAR